MKKKIDKWEEKLKHLLWQFDNRIDTDEKYAKTYWEDEFISFISSLIAKAKKERNWCPENRMVYPF